MFEYLEEILTPEELHLLSILTPQVKIGSEQLATREKVRYTFGNYERWVYLSSPFHILPGSRSHEWEKHQHRRCRNALSQTKNTVCRQMISHSDNNTVAHNIWTFEERNTNPTRIWWYKCEQSWNNYMKFRDHPPAPISIFELITHEDDKVVNIKWPRKVSNKLYGITKAENYSLAIKRRRFSFLRHVLCLYIKDTPIK